MKIAFTVPGVPPKKDGASSMWGKPAEWPRIAALRIAAHAAMGGLEPDAVSVWLTVRVYAVPGAGDLDNFATGICDALMAAHRGASVAPSLWAQLPDGAKPDRFIAFRDDSVVSRILIERLPPPIDGPRYDVELEWVATPSPAG